MERGEISRREVETKLNSVGDYVKMDYLQQCLKKNLDFDTRKFVLTTLSGIYETRHMLLESGKLIRASAEINTTFEGKMNEYMKSVQLFIKAGAFDEVDISFAKALACAAERQKEGLKQKRKDWFKAQADEFLKKDKRKHAMGTYERLLTFELQQDEKMAAQETLLHIYEKLGKIKEYAHLKKSMH
ncbi:hypothetical protein HYZ97_04880 [Candidatus Pacearchaeota archaeon]|nr:hypothetical protein [Candidatus Pacearchaeota archaeon]